MNVVYPTRVQIVRVRIRSAHLFAVVRLAMKCHLLMNALTGMSAPKMMQPNGVHMNAWIRPVHSNALVQRAWSWPAISWLVLILMSALLMQIFAHTFARMLRAVSVAAVHRAIRWTMIKPHAKISMSAKLRMVAVIKCVWILMVVRTVNATRASFWIPIRNSAFAPIRVWFPMAAVNMFASQSMELHNAFAIRDLNWTHQITKGLKWHHIIWTERIVSNLFNQSNGKATFSQSYSNI